MTRQPQAPSDAPASSSSRYGPVEEFLIVWLIRILLALPQQTLTRIFGRPPAAAEGLSPDAWALARLIGAVEGDPYEQSPAEARGIAEIFTDAIASERPPGDTEDLRLETATGPLETRLYVPSGAAGTGPLLVYFHGGGFVIGSIGTHDHPCRMLAAQSGARVLSVEYRLAPERPFPAGVDDALAAWRAVSDEPARFGADPARIAVGGDSAGGNIAAVLCQDLKRAGEPQPALQVLLYPVTVVGGMGGSYDDFAEGFFLTRRDMEWYTENYLGGQDPEQVRVAPIREGDLSGLAPAYVVTALADPLRDEGEAYAARLHEAGVPVRLDRMPLLHGWFNMTGSRSSRRALAILAGAVAERLAD